MSRDAADVTTGAYSWVLQRPDGVGFGATSHDRQLQVGSALTLEPDLDLRPSEMRLSDELFGSSLDLEGGLSSPALTDRDLRTGRWNDASVQLLAVDWDGHDDMVPIIAGGLGEVRVEAEKLAMAVDVLPRAVREPPCIQTSPECRAVLGDDKCRIDMRSRQQRATVTAVSATECTVDAGDVQRFAMGRLRWISGSNCGIEQMIVTAEGSRLTLQNATALTVCVGDQAVLREGCDGRRATCSERFSNIQNFRGEPDLPGSEILLRYPGA